MGGPPFKRNRTLPFYPFGFPSTGRGAFFSGAPTGEAVFSKDGAVSLYTLGQDESSVLEVPAQRLPG
jgi:hypothetical protein